ncbi:MAG: hypothetical protein HW386_1164 [Gammaproteobacteria bacterium]|nr:hypothetical protein [Gammaproteobacteria bacterium]
MYRLSQRLFILSILTLSISAHVYADGLTMPGEDYVLPDLYQMKPMQWQHVDDQNPESPYESAMNNNGTLLQGAVINYLESKLSSLGVPHTAMTLTGAALIFAIGQDAKLDLNESKTMSLQFQDLREADRAILYRMKYSW